jgi:ubiquitin C-terminal hydrolase
MNNPNDNKNNNNMLHEFNQNPSNQHKVENEQKNVNDMQAQKNKINQDNYNNNIPYSFSRYKKASKTGLKNLGNTSYLNSVLQILCYIRSFASYFLNPKNGEEFKNKVSDYKVSYVFHRLCTHIFPYPEKDNIEIYEPDTLLKVLSLYNVTYKDYKEKNPNDLIVFILYKLHEELNSLKMYDSSKYISNSTSTMIFNDKDASVKNGIKKFTQVNKSIISNYFTWFEIKESQCLKCSKKIYNLQNFSTFQLNIFDLIKYKKPKYIKIEDCFELYISPKTKNNVCRFCNSYNNIITTTNIYSAPNIFIFLLDYTNYIDNNDFSFVLERKINLGKYIENKNGPTNYILNGIVYWDKNKNKYQAFSASPVDKNWYLCDDENVTSTDVNNFIDIFNKNLCYKPFILVYHYLNN